MKVYLALLDSLIREPIYKMWKLEIYTCYIYVCMCVKFVSLGFVLCLDAKPHLISTPLKDCEIPKATYLGCLMLPFSIICTYSSF